MIDMQPLPSSPKSAEQPRLRAACDACRQSKVRCSGGQVCVRCEKHDFKCTYSIASRAGKPKGSKNKATLKKLENLHVTKRNTSSSSSRTKTANWAAPKMPTDPNYLYLRDRRKSASLSTAVQYEMGWPSQGHASTKTSDAFRKYSRDILCPSPISPAFRLYTLGGSFSIDLDAYGSAETPYLLSPAQSQYIHSPGKESTNLSNMPTERPTPVDWCGCMQRQVISENQLHNLGRDPSQWLFDSTMDAVFSSLSSCQMVFNCTVCSKNTDSLISAVHLLDRLFSVFAHVVFQAVPHNLQDQGAWCDPYSSIPHEYVSAARKSLVERTLKSSYETLDLLRCYLDSDFDFGNVDDRLESTDFGIFPNLDIAHKPLLTDQILGMFGADTGNNNTYPQSTTEQLPSSSSSSPPLVDKGKPGVGFGSGDINFLRQVVSRYDSILDGIRASISYNNNDNHTSESVSGPATFAIQAPRAPWFSHTPDASSHPQQIHYQPPTPSFQDVRGAGIYDVIGVS